ncbi:thymidine phosphorylase [Methylobacterium gnaphalii]|uniref:Thymidine phosphorylase n=1 Tax=Methylobacterium gnaphalii TaxID=1010610 RepID=A0A512JGN1_9HYPH|nr:thymidine phosphorylase [Methylobacterium gnaphalii]GEP09118.1 thymidine phosphorylase [Methylobacterium gnaphalii]GJD68432.1 Thymidine phosphorylase [Methylobacterium gnaphalii]GLS50559.1 thymidine phosphorylase [Methylobacterium gnaphalii]
MKLPQEVIRAKRDGALLDEATIAGFISGLTDGSVTEGQAAAFAMAVFFRGLSLGERVTLTRAMTQSGTVLRWDLPGPVLDKHSTGGIGDAVSLALAPMVAACGGYVPMISGRGLGHTGGTLDKLESIAGYDATPGLDAFRKTVTETGCAIIGQTSDLAPADKRLYAIRDITGTVESLDLITASILSKKLAAGLNGLVMDVKAGSGAFMGTLDEARALAESIVGVGNGAGMRTVALITDMDAPLASAAGNAVEVTYAIEYLAGRSREPRFHAVTLALAAEMLVAGGLAADVAEGAERLERALDSGQAAERFERMIAGLGGPSNLLRASSAHLPKAPVIQAVEPEAPGIVTRIATREIGLAVIRLGGGRTRPQDGIDHAVGFSSLARPGDTVGAGAPLGMVHARDEGAAEVAAAALRAAYRVGVDALEIREAILERVS